MQARIASKFTKTIRYSSAVLVMTVAMKAKSEVGYYTIEENKQQFTQSTLDPISIFDQISQQAKERLLSLMNWFFHAEEEQLPDDPYKRLKHFGAWKVDSREGSCFNTRARILERTSLVPVELASNGCSIRKGEWLDPYTGDTFTDASAVQIDHVVPLKNAYQRGAWRWDKVKRCLYANYRWNDYHLIPVDGFENSSKGDSAPDDYMPPNLEYKCEYLKVWLKIKLVWGLEMSTAEAQAIKSEAQTNSCDLESMKFSERELEQERTQIVENLEMCQ